MISANACGWTSAILSSKTNKPNFPEVLQKTKKTKKIQRSCRKPKKKQKKNNFPEGLQKTKKNKKNKKKTIFQRSWNLGCLKKEFWNNVFFCFFFGFFEVLEFGVSQDRVLKYWFFWFFYFFWFFRGLGIWGVSRKNSEILFFWFSKIELPFHSSTLSFIRELCFIKFFLHRDLS